jgi:iduronate 2-sulfatase
MVDAGKDHPHPPELNAEKRRGGSRLPTVRRRFWLTSVMYPSPARLGRRVALALLSLSALALAVRAADARPRNVLFLIADDLNTMLGSYGDPQARTPQLDRLAARGARFERAYCTFPLCGPSRNSMLTGLYPNSTGILANAEIFRQSVPQQISLPQAFRRAGAWAVRIGKLYHYGVPNSIGTAGHDDPASWEVGINPAGVDRLEEHPEIFSLRPASFGGTVSWYASPRDETRHTDHVVASEAEWVLERCARQPDRPFFLAVGFYRPHTPYVSPQRYFDLHPREAQRVVSGVTEDQADLPAAALGSANPEEAKMTDDQRRAALQAYAASISFMDAQVGRVIAALDRLGLAESTTIVFTSDHGYHTGEHGLWQKRSLFEESARVPLLIIAPGTTRPASVVAAPVSQLDLYPTLAAIAGVPAPANLQGQDLTPLLIDPSREGRGWALCQVTRRSGEDMYSGYSLRTARWRYTEWDEGRQGRELYDHANDPRELTNLAESRDHAATVAELSPRLRSAVQASFPASGKRPVVKQGNWMPMLVDP